MAKAPSVTKWLAGDTTYLATKSALEKALKDYKARMAQQRGQYDTEYNMNLGNLNTSRRAAVGDQQNDFASRGVLHSGVYAKSLGELQSDYDARQNALTTGRANYRADLASALKDFQTEQGLALQNARQNAINRRAAKYGI